MEGKGKKKNSKKKDNNKREQTLVLYEPALVASQPVQEFVPQETLKNRRFSISKSEIKLPSIVEDSKSDHVLKASIRKRMRDFLSPNTEIKQTNRRSDSLIGMKTNIEDLLDGFGEALHTKENHSASSENLGEYVVSTEELTHSSSSITGPKRSKSFISSSTFIRWGSKKSVSKPENNDEKHEPKETNKNDPEDINSKIKQHKTKRSKSFIDTLYRWSSQKNVNKDRHKENSMSAENIPNKDSRLQSILTSMPQRSKSFIAISGLKKSSSTKNISFKDLPKATTLSLKQNKRKMSENLWENRPHSMFNENTIREEPEPDSLRSRSMNNIDSLLSSNSYWSDKYCWASVECDFGKLATELSVSSMPEISAQNLKDDWPYLSETTNGKAWFKLKHSFSEGFLREFFELIIPQYVIAKFTSHTKPNLTIKNVIYMPAIKNICLSDILDYSLSAYISVNKYNYFLRGVTTPLSEKLVDTWTLAGKVVEMEEKKQTHDNLKINILKDTKKNKAKYFSKSAEESVPRRSESGLIMNTPTEAKGKSTGVTQKFNQLMSLFSNKSDSLEMERLEAKLLEMGDNVPQLPIYTPFPMSKDCADALLTIESRIVEKMFNLSELNLVEVLQQRVLLEILSTEASYINHIKTAVEIFYSAAYAIQEEGIMMDVDTDRLFYNIAEVLNSSLRLWAQFFYPMLEEAILTRKKFNPELFYQGLARFEEIFTPYENFVLHQMKIQNYSRYVMQTNPVYTAYLTWCEAHKECNRLRFSDIMIKPLQRLTKYKLLLQNVIDTVEIEEERIYASKLLIEIQTFITRVDNSVRYKQECSSFELAVNSIEGYDVFSKEDTDQFLKQHLDLNLRSPMPNCEEKYQRFLIIAGDVRMRDSLDFKADVKAFLFTDYLLICGPNKTKKKYIDKYRVIRQKYMVDKLKFYPVRDNTNVTIIHFIVLDETGTATARFTFTEAKNHALHEWEDAMYEAKYTLHMIRLLNLIPNFDLSKYNPCNYEIEPPPVVVSNSKSVVANAIKRVQCQQTGTFHNIRPDSPDQYGMLSEDERKGGDSKSPGKTSNSTKGGKSVGSSRASRVSSFQQSHSGSTEYTESRRMISADTSVDRRTISMSSDEYALPTMQNLEVDDQKTIRSRTSPGWSNRLSITNHRDPNTLSVNIPESLLFGQSMPDLAQENSTTSSNVIVIPPSNLNVPTEPNRYLRAGSPSGALGPDNRGISYPPPSPRASLRRGIAFSQTPKNPLVKSRHITREASSATLPQGSPKFDKSPSKSPAQINDPTPPVIQAINFTIVDESLQLPDISTEVLELDSISKESDKDIETVI